ncbi:MAG TPA: phosphatase PAP2-related protein [Tepidisphaeraceae bacterium]|nr:phosphatase PAP2-related protein [Tepidisphaeraceae bacterium]
MTLDLRDPPREPSTSTRVRQPLSPPWRLWLLRLGLVALSLFLWFWTQSLLGSRPVPLKIGDGLHDLTASTNSYLLSHPKAANALLIASSVIIDMLAIFILASTIVGRSITPFLSLLMLFALRQIIQALCPLPPPNGMIWHHPGFPSLLVTYGVPNDLFFSGHTALALLGACVLAKSLGKTGIILGLLIALFEIATVVLLRAHYTMDIFTGAITALYIWTLANRVGPKIDQPLSRLARRA